MAEVVCASWCLLVRDNNSLDVCMFRMHDRYAVAFGMSIVWIGALCYCMVEQVITERENSNNKLTGNIAGLSNWLRVSLFEFLCFLIV